jgi:tRNA acetyltransferase TAN1
VVFFKTISPVEPVSLVKRICEDAIKDSSQKRTRFAKRLSPMTLIGRASAEGLEKVATEVLAPYFHLEPRQRRKVCAAAALASGLG